MIYEHFREKISSFLSFSECSCTLFQEIRKKNKI